ncbi:hypothetical protein AURDEDRAFT_76731 [Auricularia subglabra TFB-10046 SS5]|uniref:Ubiquitin-like protease family profile domain-containing protein n=1 Tax=Auricularia subglabra (strain TFB-10046 / SS5) TaxID=717982 RepID=J0CTU9_AURST|nr:hypothetical protein AURDEDRAFT_76731 [Auricularia subglabra TFB-10046 SS5]
MFFAIPRQGSFCSATQPLNRDLQGVPILEGFRRTLGDALTWYDLLRTKVDQSTRDRIAAAKVAPPPSPIDIWIAVAAKYALTPEGRKEISQYLVGRCSSCFAAAVTGTPLAEGCDFHFATDACFGHRHDENAGDCPPIDQPLSPGFVPKDFIDAVGEALDAARARPARRNTSAAPEAAVSQCEKAHTAANGSRQKAAGSKHDIKGMGAIVCRHDIPLVVCNIDTPGEQQKYSFGMLIWLLMLLPSNATVLNLYDIGCVTDKTVRLYEILTPSMEKRVLFATSAMHAYAHQWQCQLVYSPRLQSGMGLTDGEGVERLWSRIRKLISILRGAHLQRRMLILDGALQWIADTKRDELGQWLGGKWKKLRLRECEAREEIRRAGYSARTLREQWALQRESQLSMRKLTAPRLKKELEAVMEIQDQIQSVEESIATLEESLRTPNVEATQRLDDLRTTLAQLTRQAEKLYSALNVQDDFPEISEYGVDFVRALIKAYDAKCIARQKLIGRFFEWEHLDQAVGGRGEPLGTKQHQRVLQAIQKRGPATMNAITRYNDACAKVRELLPPGKQYPLPEPLSTDLTTLKDDPALLEDVWLSGAPDQGALWLTDKAVRVAIRAQQLLDRCDEEKTRLRREEQQLFDWLELEARAVVHALYDPASDLRRELARLEDLALRCKRLNIAPARWRSAVRQPLAEADARARARIAAADASGPPGDVCAPPAELVNDAPVAEAEFDGNFAGMLTPPTTPHHVRMAPAPALVPAEDGEDDSAEEAQEVEDDSSLELDDGDPFEDPAPAALYRDAEGAFTRLNVAPAALRTLSSRVSVNEEIIYGGMAALFKELAPHRTDIAVFQPYDYTMWKSTAQRTRLYRQVTRTEFWKKNIILVPIHQDPHWMLAVVYPQLAKIDFFDSMGMRSTHRHHSQSVAHLITALLKLAAAKGEQGCWPAPEKWRSRALVSINYPRQAGTEDCGPWVLAETAAVLLQYRATSLVQDDMPRFRAYILAVMQKHIPAVK